MIRQFLISITALLILASCGDQSSDAPKPAPQDYSGLENILKFDDEQQESPNYKSAEASERDQKSFPIEMTETLSSTRICKSTINRAEQCQFDKQIVGIKIDDQLSNKKCIYGETFGVNGKIVWVREGCQAVFRVKFKQLNLSEDELRKTQITCESTDYKLRYCKSINQIRSITLSKKLSNSACIKGSTYGFDRNRIWVSNGCSGLFNIYYK